MTSFRGVIRKAVLLYSIKNRRRKAESIREWLDQQNCRSLLFVGAMGDESIDNPGMANAGIVEKAVATGRHVIAGINITPAITTYPFVLADARRLPFGDNSVDFALANAVIEHVGSELDQRQMVSEMSRVAKCWVITTPNRWFPIESHTSTVVLHWVPRWRRRHTEQFTRLLSRREFRDLLPPGARLAGSPLSPTFTARFARHDA